jgi:hypothetical protein
MPRKKKLDSVSISELPPNSTFELMPELSPNSTFELMSKSSPNSTVELMFESPFKLNPISSNINSNNVDDDIIDNKLSRDDLIPKHPCRENLYRKLFGLLDKYKESYSYCEDDLQKFALNIERGIFNYAVSNSSSKDWDYMFKYYYINKAVTIYTNLNPDSYLKNTELIHGFFKKEFTEFELAYFDSEKLFPSRYYELIEIYRDKSKPYVKQEATNDGAHFCGKCKTYKTTYYQLQTRSAKIIGWKSTLLITSWLCYWENSCSPSLILRC